MKISDIYSAKGSKFKLNLEDNTADFKEGLLVRIVPAQSGQRMFLVNQYGEGIKNSNPVLCSTGTPTASHLNDLFESEHEGDFRCMFMIEGVGDNYIEIQTYTFRSVTEYRTPITIIVTEQLLAKGFTAEKLADEYIWKQLGMPALFCLNYKKKKKQDDYIRFIGGKRYLTASNSARGIFAEKVNYQKERYYVPVDIFLAPEIKFVLQEELAVPNAEMSADLDKISNPASYFARWEAYDALSAKLIEAESAEFGELKYLRFEERPEVNGTVYEFVLDEELDDSLLGKEIAVSEEEKIIDQATDKPVRKRQIGVGCIQKISGKNIVSYKPADESVDLIPKTGIIRLYTAGDKYIMMRRKAARDRMIKHRSPIKGIVSLIEAGSSGYELPNAWGSHPGITEELKRNFKKAVDLNPEQIAALELAINTPDIALIQGPPGTGKTTVIKAICERFREIFEAEEKQLQKADEAHVLRSPKILISSFQNDAVDNAISAPLPGDIPAYRKTAKRTKDSSKEQYQRALDTWYQSLRKTISEMIEDTVAADYAAQKRQLDDEFLSYKNAGETIDRAAELVKHYLSFVDISYPDWLKEKAQAVIRAANASESEEDEENPIVAKLESQRLTKEAFDDDGARNARRLAAFIRTHKEMEFSGEDLELIELIGEEDDFTDNDFDRYVALINRLKKRYCGSHTVIDESDHDKINECLLALEDAYSNHYLNSLTTLESKKSLILSDFIDRLEQDYESIVKKYSMTTAATCQTSLDLRDGTDKTFDLVIVDEAARANPLDLFIPMSMGRKIVLVGDHKQLPHMLEPDVLKLLSEDPKFQDIPEIEKSLFERLFEMFSKGQHIKAIPLTRQFRMHPDICRFVSESFYDGQLQTDKSITPDKRSSPGEINQGMPLTLVHVPISRGMEHSGASKSRWAEVEAIGADVKKILSVVPTASIGIITFYSAQATLLRTHLDTFLNDEQKNYIEIGTVDAFQGKEFDYVLLSCVRSNKAKTVGFLVKPNRLCVAFSRSIRQLAVYGDIETLDQIPCFARLFEICATEKGGNYREY